MKYIMKKKAVIKSILQFFKKSNKGLSQGLVKVHSHPRSGTHYLEAFLGENFYEKLDLKFEKVVWGHWSDRRINPKGNAYGKLFGNHYFPESNQNKSPKIYIYRDGRAVAYSFWKTENFVNKELNNLSFSEFLRAKIDWSGTPSNRAPEEITLLDHWALHVSEWMKYAESNSHIILIKYEDLINKPFQQYLLLHEKFFTEQQLKREEDLDLIRKPVGILPNEAKVDSWKRVFTNQDLSYFNSIIEEYNLNDLWE